MKRVSFGYAPEEGQNPYIGFTSFQHFRGERLYSDIVVREENRRTETERVECYPISPDAEENGRSEGWYPDSSVAYIRVLWKELEPRRGEYNLAFIENILKEAEAHKQTLILRLMAHSTRAEDDVPDWLRELIPCPARPPMERVKDSPTDPLFMELFLKAIRVLGEHFDANPWLDGVDISLPGSWGEGHNLELYPEDLLYKIVDTYIEAFPTTQLYTQIIRPHLVKYAEGRAAVGWRGDGLGDPYHITEYYPPNIERMKENWKKAPVSFEAYWWMCEWQRQGWDLDTIIEKTLSWHISSFNPKSMPIPYDWQGKCKQWLAKMGYHFTLKVAEYEESLSLGDALSVMLEVENCGCAPCYKPLPVVLRLRSGALVREFLQDTDIRLWLPGSHRACLMANTEGMAAGEYSLELAILSPHADTVYLATDAKRVENGYRIGTLTLK